jgi:DNA-directed RNA polymerase subunit RPC12/RpoP
MTSTIFLVLFIAALAVFAYEFARRIVLVRRCAWCGRLRGFRLTRSGGTSHTICKRCVHKIMV